MSAAATWMSRNSDPALDSISRLANKGLLVEEKDVLIAYGDDVVVKYPGVDGCRRLLSEHQPFGTEPMETGYGARCLQGLPGGITSRGDRFSIDVTSSVHKEVEPRISVVRAEARMVRRAFVAEYLGCG